MRQVGLALLCVICVSGQNGAKRPLTHRDYDSWRSIQTPTVSRDGRYVAYALFPQEGDGHLVVYDVKARKERRDDIGALPPPPETPAEASPDEPPPRPGIRMAFTRDSRYLVFSTLPKKGDVEAARKQKKPALKNGLGIWDLSGAAPAMRIADVKSFQVPEKGTSWVAYLKDALSPPITPEPTPAEPRPQTAVPPAAAPKPLSPAPRPEFGTELVLLDCSKARPERKFADVIEYSLSKDGETLVYAVASRKGDTNGVYALAINADAVTPLMAGKGKYSKLTWDYAQTRLVFLSDRLHLWERRGATPAIDVVSVSTPGFPQGFAISDRGAVQFSRDGSRVFFGTAPSPLPKKGSETPGEDTVIADLWHWKDPYIQPMQKVRAAQERSRSYRAVYHIADKKFVQLATTEMAGLNASDDGRFAIGGDDRAYRSMIDYDRGYTDLYLVETTTAARKRVLEKGESGFGGMPSVSWAPDGTKVLFYRDRSWHVLDTRDSSIRNVTANIEAPFFNEDFDRPEQPSPYGSAGWTSDSASVLLYDRFDVWQVQGDGRTFRNMTESYGRKNNLQLRVVRLEREDDDDAPRGINPAKPVILRAENLQTRDTGFFRDRVDGDSLPQQLVMTAKNLRTIAKAQDADVVLMTASTFSQFPDLQVTDMNFRSPRKISDANPQQSGLLWGTSELIGYRSSDGIPLQAALYKPENFDPKKKYPLMVYIYERLSQSVNNFVEPRPGTSINVSYYVSNGYLVLTPDIVYTTGSPGPSAIKSVLPAIQAVADRGSVNENAIGIQGHSWGGYQIAYMLTQTRRFRAAEAGAPVGNMTSAYNGIRWGSGLPRQFQYERTQSRIGGSLWQFPLQFIENSPVFHVQNVTTPLLIVHNDQDDAVPWYQGIELYLSLRRHGKEVYLFNYNGEKHGIRKRVNQKDYTVRMQQFFDHFLKGGAQPEWMEKGIPYLERETEKARFSTATDR